MACGRWFASRSASRFGSRVLVGRVELVWGGGVRERRGRRQLGKRRRKTRKRLHIREGMPLTAFGEGCLGLARGGSLEYRFGGLRLRGRSLRASVLRCSDGWLVQALAVDIAAFDAAPVRCVVTSRAWRGSPWCARVFVAELRGSDGPGSFEPKVARKFPQCIRPGSRMGGAASSCSCTDLGRVGGGVAEFAAARWCARARGVL